MKQVCLEENGKEPGTSYLASLIDEARKNNIRYIFIQKQFNAESAKTMAKEINAEVIEIDPLAEDWYNEMKEIHHFLVTD